MLVPLIPFALGMVIGARREAGSWSRLIGVDAVDWISRTSQHSRWAGSYLASVVKAGFVAVAAALALAAVLLAVDLFVHWNLVVAVYEALDAGAVGGAALTVAQLGYLPNLVVFALAWTSGAGFAMGVGSQVGPLGTAVGPAASIPVLAAIPAGALDYAFVALMVPVLAGRAGRLVVPPRRREPLRRVAVHQGPCPLVHGYGVHPGPGSTDRADRRDCWPWGWPGWPAARPGIGRLTDIGPDPLWTGVWLAAEVGIGVVIGYAAGPWLERERGAADDAELVH